MRLRPELALVSVVGVALAATAALGGTSRVGVTATYKLVFQGSGRATSTYPPRPDGTVFTSSISWTLVYEVAVSNAFGLRSSWLPQAGSTITGSSNGAATASGLPIEPGCEQIAFSLDRGQTGGSYAGGNQPRYDLSITVPGFAGGALIGYSPGQCESPFPTDCPDRLGTQMVTLDSTKASQTSQLSASCDFPAQGETGSWSGTVTATRTSSSEGNGCVLADIGLRAVSADAANDAWAVGSCDEEGAVEHWDGKQWALASTLPPPASQFSIFTGVSAVSPTDVWVVGYDQAKNGSYGPLVLHWNGSVWTTVAERLPRAASVGGFQLNSVAATTGGAWVAGISVGPRGLFGRSGGSGLVASLDKGTRVIVQTVFSGVAIASARDVWVVGNSNARGFVALTEHWNGRTWREVRTPRERGVELDAAVAAGGGVWAVGSSSGGGVVERWNGARWSIQASTAVPLTAVAASSPTSAWAVGWSARKGGVIEHWDGRSWNARTEGNLSLTGVAASSADDAWAVAGPTILHWDGHSWASVQSG